jgi:hypothetical protein
MYNVSMKRNLYKSGLKMFKDTEPDRERSVSNFTNYASLITDGVKQKIDRINNGGRCTAPISNRRRSIQPVTNASLDQGEKLPIDKMTHRLSTMMSSE